MAGCKFKGSALISALFIMTMVAIAATAMSMRLQLDIYRTHMTILADKVYLASQYGTFWAMDMLAGSKNKIIRTDGNGLAFSLPASMQSVYPNMQIVSEVYDLQGRFNVNNLSDERYYLAFLRLLKKVLPETNDGEQKKIAQALREWVSAYIPGNRNSFSGYYLGQKPSYLPAHLPLQSISELRLVYGITPNVYNKLKNYVTALPEPTAININSAPQPVLYSLAHGLNQTRIEELTAARGKKGFKNQKKMEPVLKKLNINNNLLTLESSYFLSITTVKAEDIKLTNFSIIKRVRNNKNKTMISLVSESLNAM
ncbi:type II secretion system minor pseudopilin GspK [Legionella dresdenensis]|uniref:Type II secretion system protein K n=1 Tax=Legionella dresdenensis TaxID=450200 RepID=A0ABV8CCB9_9GAMM